MSKEALKSIETEPKGGVIALDRGLKILMALNIQGGLTLSEISRKTDLNKTTILRLLSSLERAGFVYRIGNDYKLGASLFALANTQSESDFIRDLITPTLNGLAKHTGETATFYMKHARQRICVAIAAGSHLVRPNVSIGDILPLVGATGRVFLAFSAGKPDIYEGELQQSFGERDPELAAIAAPIFARDGKLMGALSLTGTCSRFASPDYLKAISVALQEACQTLNQTLSARNLNEAKNPAE